MPSEAVLRERLAWFTKEVDRLRARVAELEKAVNAAVDCLDYIHPGGRPGEPPNPLAVIADRSIAEQLMRKAVGREK